MAVLFTNGDPIKAIQGTGIVDFCAPGDAIAVDGMRLNTALLLDNASFLGIYKLWIKPCIDFMRACNNAIPSDEGIKSLFKDDKQPDKQTCFYKEFSDFISGKGSYGTALGGALWFQLPNIEQTVENALDGASAYMRLRVKTVCMLLGCDPQDVFNQKGNWALNFLPNPAEKNGAEVEDGTVFELDLSPAKQLTPKMLCNPGEERRTIIVQYGEKSYSIKIPPHGYIKALFNEKDHLVCVKGSISFNPALFGNAFVHVTGGEKPGVYMCHQAYNQAFQFSMNSIVLDVAADGHGAAIFLCSDSLYDAGKNKKIKRSPLPVYIYGAGSLWAYQYADGHLETNLFQNGQPVDHAYAIVENVNNNNMSLMLFDGKNVWSFNGGEPVQVSMNTFVEAMMARFHHNGICEKVASYAMALTINSDGELEVKRG